MASHHTNIIVFVWAVLLCGCLGEVEHTNPLDPNAPGFDSVGTLGGVTTRFYPQYTPVEEATVTLEPGMYSVESNQEGRFAFRDVPAGEYRLSAAKEGFESPVDTVLVELGASVDSTQVRLDGLPIFRSVSVYSTHISRWFPTEDLYRLDAVVLIEDPDGLGDVDSVWLAIPSRQYEHALRETNIAGQYEEFLLSDSLPGSSLYALQGDQIVVEAMDVAGFISRSAPQHILRVIDLTPVAVDPQGQETIRTPTPTLTWEDAALPYEFTYRIEIVHDQADVQTTVYTKSDIPPDSLSHVAEMELPPGTYYWTVFVVDQYGNRSRSKEAGFIIEYEDGGT